MPTHWPLTQVELHAQMPAHPPPMQVKLHAQACSTVASVAQFQTGCVPVLGGSPGDVEPCFNSRDLGFFEL